MSLSERERRALARIEHHLRETDPRLARLLSTGRAGIMMRLHGLPPPARLLIAGLVMMVVGSVTLMLPLAVAGAVAAVFGLLLALLTQPMPRFG